MKLISSLALGAALLGGSAIVMPAMAKEKAAAAPAAPSYKLSKEFRAAIAPAQAAIKANDPTAAAKLDAADALAKEPDEKYVAAAVRLELGSAQKNAAIQAAAVEAMLASGAAPAADLPKLNFYAGQFAYQANDTAKALKYLTEGERLGYKQDSIYLLLAETNFKLNQIAAGLPFVDKAIAASTAAGTKPPEAWYARAFGMAYKGKLMGEAARWSRAQVQAYPTAMNWRNALIVFRDSAQRDGQQMVDIFRLMRASKSLAGERDYFEFAALCSERGLPGEAKAIIDEGMATGTVPAGSRALSELRATVSAKIPADQASLASAEKAAMASANGRLAANTGDAFLGYGQDAKAIALYRAALTKGGADVDAVNTRLGIALMRSGDKDGARTAFQAVKGQRADIAAFWLLWLDTPMTA